MGWRARPSAHKSPESNPGLTYQTQEGGGLAAKDGTNCGGRRVRAGAKPDPLKDKLEVGKPASRLLEPADLGDGLSDDARLHLCHTNVLCALRDRGPMRFNGAAVV